MGKQREKDNGVYVITAKGVMSTIVESGLAERLYNALELYGLRNHAKTGQPAILLTPKGGTFITVNDKEVKP
jgi:hypothetical protein